MANILHQKGLGVKVQVKTVKKHVFVEGKPEKSTKGVYNLTLSAGAKKVSATCHGTNEVFSKAYAIMAAHFPAAYKKFSAIQKAETAERKAKAKASRKAKKMVSGADLKSLSTLLNRVGKGKGNGKVVALFL